MQPLVQQLAPARIPPLPAPPVMERLLFEQPLPLFWLFLASGVIVFLVMRRGGYGRAGLACGGGLALFGAGVIALANVVRTDREQMAQATSDLVHAAASADMPSLERLLAPDARLFSRYQAPGFGIKTSGWDRDAILRNDAQFMKQYQIAEPSVRECQAISTGPSLGSTQVQVRIQAVPTGDFRITHQSWWRIDWRREEDRWVVTAIEPLDIPWATAVD